MKRFAFVLIFGLSFCTMLSAQKQVILDTDPSADPDDVGCMAMLHNLATIGECEILGMINSTEYKQSSLSISAINEFYRRKAIPVGDYKGYPEKKEALERNYDAHLARVYPRSLNSWKEATDGVKLYREILASAAPESITIVIIGTMHNFYGLLQSSGDQFSPLDGKALVREKVKEVVTMGGNFIGGKGYDRTNWGGSDQLCDYTDWSCLNAERNRMCRYVIENCPSPFIASGWEVGCGDYYDAGYGNVMTGNRLRDLDTTHILRRSYEYHFLTRRETSDISRHSNDQCALHYAVRGERNNYVAVTNGTIRLTSTGVCTWDGSENSGQGYIQKARDKMAIAREIEMLMMAPRPPVDMAPPTAPGTIISVNEGGYRKIKWKPSAGTVPGSWVVGYNIYVEDKLVKTAFGTQATLTGALETEAPLEIRAVNAAGIESQSTWLR